MTNIQLPDSPRATVFTLPNGLRCVHRLSPGQVAYCGVAINAGSRDEPADKEGLAHFVEHTLFKGTLRRRSWHISNRMESVGGELNAYTSKEETMVYASAPAPFSERAIELISDIVANSTFPVAELIKEKAVVIEEIKSYLDSPEDKVFDEFENLIYSGSALGHNILGTQGSVERLESSDCRAFLDRFYVPNNMVVYVADPYPAKRAEKFLTKHFGSLHFPKPSSERIIPPEVGHFEEIKNEHGYQAHTLMGARLFGRTDPRRYPLFLLNNYFGGPCMNSRLNQELRDKRGYVYTVESNVALMSDCGLIQIYFGSDTKRTEECKRLIIKELEKIADNGISAGRFEAVKRQYAGQLILASANTESVAMQTAKSLLYFNEVHDTTTTAREIMAVSRDDIKAIAAMILEKGLSALTLT